MLITALEGERTLEASHTSLSLSVNTPLRRRALNLVAPLMFCHYCSSLTLNIPSFHHTFWHTDEMIVGDDKLVFTSVPHLIFSPFFLSFPSSHSDSPSSCSFLITLFQDPLYSQFSVSSHLKAIEILTTYALLSLPRIASIHGGKSLKWKEFFTQAYH